VGVSPTTVSIVLNGRHKERRISQKVIQAVRDSARRLGYVPDIAARRMRSKDDVRHLYLAIMSSFEAPLMLLNRLLFGAERFLSGIQDPNLSFSIAIEPFHAGRLRQHPGLRATARFHGLLIANTLPEDDRFLSENPLPVPAVLFGRRVPGYSSVFAEMDQIGWEAAEILRQTGRRRLAILRPKLLTQATQARFDAFLKAAGEAGLAKPDDVVAENFSELAAHEAMRKYLRRDGKADGLFALSDILAVGGYHALKSRGRRIPQDVAVIGCDDMDFSPFLDPPLSTFSLRVSAMQEEAVRLLVRRLLGQLEEIVRQSFSATPVLRESTGHGKAQAPAREPRKTQSGRGN
jgi:LacI family transcriptional regulator